jgi:hypothetical protein
MILNCVVSATLENFGDLGPLVTIISVHQVKDPLFLFTPANLLNLRVQMVVPSFSTLLTDASWKILSDESPFLGSIFVNQMKNHLILFISPRALDETWIQDLLPAMKTLNVSSPRKLFGNLLPVFAPMLANSFCKVLIL